MDKDDLREAWSKIQRCYQLDKVDPDPHTIEFLEQTSNLREDLYRRCPPEGGALPILVQPVRIADNPSEGEEIAAAVRKLQTERAGGPSVMKAEYLNAWLQEATREKYPDTKKWDKLVSIT